jgi:hypothetical protein
MEKSTLLGKVGHELFMAHAMAAKNRAALAIAQIDAALINNLVSIPQPESTETVEQSIPTIVVD